MKNYLLSFALLAGICASAQQKVKVHADGKSYVTTIDYISFDAEESEASISVANMQQKEKNYAYFLTSNYFVNLGLPSGTLWAKWNLGASTPYETGGYYMWGHINPTSDASWDNYKFIGEGADANQGMTLTKYTFDDKVYTKSHMGIVNGQFAQISYRPDWYEYELDESGNIVSATFIGDDKKSLDDEDDAVMVSMPQGFRTPTKADFDELIANCEVQLIDDYMGSGVKGYAFFMKNSDSSHEYTTNDVHIFFPLVGELSGTKVASNGIACYYWTRTIAIDGSTTAYSLRLDAYNGASTMSRNRNKGLQIRPVYIGNANTPNEDNTNYATE